MVGLNVYNPSMMDGLDLACVRICTQLRPTEPERDARFGGFDCDVSTASSMAQTLKISLDGPFSLVAYDGTEIALSGVQSKRLLAFLLRAPRHKCARDDVMALLWVFDEKPKVSNRLRQLLSKTRKSLGVYAHHLCADDTTIWLERVVEHRDAAPDVEFFTDSGLGPDEFDDWKRLQSGQTDSNPCVPALQLQSSTAIVLDLVNGETLDQQTACVAFRDVFSKSDFLVLMVEDQGAARLQVDIQETQDNTRVSLFLRQGLKLHWSHTQHLPPNLRRGDRYLALVELAHMALATAEAKLSATSQEPPLFGTVLQLFSLDSGKVLAATDRLSGFDHGETAAASLAWRAFGFMLLNGEKLIPAGNGAAPTAFNLLRDALDLDPGNASALAIMAQYFAFVERDLDLARDFSRDSLSVAPYAPIVQDVASMIEIYDNRPDVAVEHARLAIKTGGSGPLKHYVGATEVILATLLGDHDHAIRKAKTILALRPNFLPVLRHLAASLAATGQVDQTMAVVAHIQKIDPNFATPAMLAPTYHLPAEASRQMIFDHLKALDLISPETSNDPDKTSISEQ